MPTMLNIKHLKRKRNQLSNQGNYLQHKHLDAWKVVHYMRKQVCDKKNCQGVFWATSLGNRIFEKHVVYHTCQKYCYRSLLPKNTLTKLLPHERLSQHQMYAALRPDICESWNSYKKFKKIKPKIFHTQSIIFAKGSLLRNVPLSHRPRSKWISLLSNIFQCWYGIVSLNLSLSGAEYR